jgi:hypothetical protein
MSISAAPAAVAARASSGVSRRIPARASSSSVAIVLPAGGVAAG